LKEKCKVVTRKRPTVKKEQEETTLQPTTAIGALFTLLNGKNAYLVFALLIVAGGMYGAYDLFSKLSENLRDISKSMASVENAIENQNRLLEKANSEAEKYYEYCYKVANKNAKG
jgi:hypothetical protein